MKSYILLVCTWLVVASYVLYSWLKSGLEPPLALWVLLGVISIIPLAQSLKIGNWLDFNKKVNNLGKEISSTQQEVREVSNRLDTFVTNVQSQQQFNLSLHSKEAAQAFAETILSTKKNVYPSSAFQEIISSGEDKFFSDKMSPTDRNRFYFVSAADEALASITPLIRALYAGVKTRQQKNLVSGEQLYGTTLTSMIEEMSLWKETFGESPQGSGDVYDTIRGFFQRIKTLIELREEVHQGSTLPPSVEEGQQLLRDIYSAQAYLEGVISTLVAVLFVPEMRGPRIPK